MEEQQEKETNVIEIRNRLSEIMNDKLAEQIKSTFERSGTEEYAIYFLKMCCEKYLNSVSVDNNVQKDVCEALDEETAELLLELLNKGGHLTKFYLKDACNNKSTDKEEDKDREI